MHVLINAASANMGGALTYLINVVRQLPARAPENRFTVVLPAASRPKVETFGPFPNVTLVDYPHADTGGLARNYFDQVEIPRMVRRLQADVLFSSTGFGTFRSPCPQVLLVRNAAYFSPEFQQMYRELGRSLRRNTVRRWLSLASIRAADVTLFPTRAMQEMVGDWIDLRGRRTEVIHYGFDHEAFAARRAEDARFERLDRWRAEGYTVLLNVSTYAVHKSFEVLVEALPHLKTAGHRVKLVTTTSREKTTDKAEYDALVRRAEALGVREDWCELGYVPYEALRSLYARADVYVFPSFTESFGHSLVEAMASGLPVVASDMPVNVEVCEAAGVYFPVFDAAACADRIGQVLCEPAVRERMRQAALRRAQAFSWQQYVDTLMACFRDLVASERKPQEVVA
ncbi:glycosyltransferase family 4 protein [Rhodocaloribacter litoris]|uniref:glycosyltransferase family 4 protein n=1 Tax=Rhodocaloribacter litoris TaxID=2558931 RepID=UPI001424358C|nr:glycosyltransferase family 1 protein [Rhodocaloribacter litoris]QXD16177.1 glycosyltransferase family 4 protein [Rhodocaloribacter litoris]